MKIASLLQAALSVSVAIASFPAFSATYVCTGLLNLEIYSSEISIDLSNPSTAQVAGDYYGKSPINANLKNASAGLSGKAKALGTIQFNGQTNNRNLSRVTLTIWPVGKDGLLYSLHSQDIDQMGIGRSEVQTYDIIRPQWICRTR